MKVDSRTELVIATNIAKRLDISSQRVYVLASGPAFPTRAAQTRRRVYEVLCVRPGAESIARTLSDREGWSSADKWRNGGVGHR